MESSNTLNRQFRSTFQLLSVSFRTLTFSKIITAGEKQNFVTSAPFTRDNKKKKKNGGERGLCSAGAGFQCTWWLVYLFIWSWAITRTSTSEILQFQPEASLPNGRCCGRGRRRFVTIWRRVNGRKGSRSDSSFKKKNGRGELPVIRIVMSRYVHARHRYGFLPPPPYSAIKWETEVSFPSTSFLSSPYYIVMWEPAREMGQEENV